MCFAGDGGGNGRLNNLLGVDALAGDGETPAGSGLAATPWGYGLGHGLGYEDRAGEFFTPLRGVDGGNLVWLRSADAATVVVAAVPFSLVGLVLP